MNFCKIFILSFLILFSFKNYSQNATACATAIAICTNTFNFPLTVGGVGLSGLASSPSISNPTTNPQGVNMGCLYTNGSGPTWLTFKVNNTGNLGFAMGFLGYSFSNAGGFDWILWKVSGTFSNTCNSIFNGTFAPVSCNWNSAASGTGIGTIPTGGSSGNFQPSIPVTVGEEFILLISNHGGFNGTCSFTNTGTALIAPCSTVTSIQNNTESNSEVSIYPNPFKDLITIKNNNTSQKEIEIYSILGQKINAYSSKEKTIEINTSELLSGIYFVKVKWDDKSVLQKLIKI